MKKAQTTLETEQIVLFRDQPFHESMAERIEQQHKLTQDFVDAVRWSDIGEIDDLTRLLSVDIAVYALDHWKGKQVVPAGHDREKYLQLLTQPNLEALIVARSNVIVLHPQLFSVKDWEVKIDPVIAETLECGNDLVIESGSKQEAIYNAVLKLEEALTEINALEHGQLLKFHMHTNALLPVNFAKFGYWKGPHDRDIKIDLEILRKLF